MNNNKFPCGLCESRGDSNITAVWRCDCDDYQCDNCKEIHILDNPDHTPKPIVKPDYQRSLSFVDQLTSLRGSMQKAQEEIEKLITDLTEKLFNEITNVSSQIQNSLNYIDNLEKELYSKGYFGTDTNSVINRYLQDDMPNISKLIDTSFSYRTGIHDLISKSSELITIKFDLKSIVEHYTKMPMPKSNGVYEKDIKETDVERFKKSLEYSSNKNIPQANLSESDKFRLLARQTRENIENVKNITRKSDKDALRDYFDNIDDYNFRVHLKKIYLTRNILQNRERSLCICKLSDVYQNIKSIEFSDLSPISVFDIFSNISNFNKVKKIIMKNCTEMNLNTYKTMGKGIKSRPELIKLIIDNCMCNGDALESIAANFIHERLTTLNLNNNLFGHSGAVALANHLPSLKSLKYLYMHNNEINTVGMSKLAPSIGKLVSLESIDVSYNQIGVEGVKILLESIRSLCYISFLDISSNFLRVEEDSNLCETISLNIQAMMSLQTIVVDMTSSPLVLKTLMLKTQPYCRIYRSNLSQRSLFSEGSKVNSYKN